MSRFTPRAFRKFNLRSRQIGQRFGKTVANAKTSHPSKTSQNAAALGIAGAIVRFSTIIPIRARSAATIQSQIFGACVMTNLPRLRASYYSTLIWSRVARDQLLASYPRHSSALAGGSRRGTTNSRPITWPSSSSRQYKYERGQTPYRAAALLQKGSDLLSFIPPLPVPSANSQAALAAARRVFGRAFFRCSSGTAAR